MTAYLALLVGVSLFVYPATFTPEQQTVFGWFENDVYVALLGHGLYLGVQHLRGAILRPTMGRPQDDERRA